MIASTGAKYPANYLATNILEMWRANAILNLWRKKPVNMNGRSFFDYSKEKGTIAEIFCLSFDAVDELTKRRYFFKERGRYCMAQCQHGYENYLEDVRCGCTEPLKGHEGLKGKPATPDPETLKLMDEVLQRMQA